MKFAIRTIILIAKTSELAKHLIHYLENTLFRIKHVFLRHIVFTGFNRNTNWSCQNFIISLNSRMPEKNIGPRNRRSSSESPFPVATRPDWARTDERLFTEIRSGIAEPVFAGSSDRRIGTRTHQSVAVHDRTLR